MRFLEVDDLTKKGKEDLLEVKDVVYYEQKAIAKSNGESVYRATEEAFNEKSKLLTKIENLENRNELVATMKDYILKMHETKTAIRIDGWMIAANKETNTGKLMVADVGKLWFKETDKIDEVLSFEIMEYRDFYKILNPDDTEFIKFLDDWAKEASVKVIEPV